MVLELSSFQLQTCSTLHPRVGILLNISENAIDYTVDFDLLVPPYDAVKVVTVDQLNTKIENSKMQTGKRLGYKFNSDDI